MTSVSHSLSACLIVAAAILMNACVSENRWEAERTVLVAEANQIKKQHQVLNERIDSLWDSTAMALAAALPADFPAIDRDIFIKARNADHMRMFMSYHALSEETKSMINTAGMYDEMLAKQVRDLQRRQQKFEQQKTQFLTNVFRHDPEAGQCFAAQFRMDSVPNVK